MKSHFAGIPNKSFFLPQFVFDSLVPFPATTTKRGLLTSHTNTRWTAFSQYAAVVVPISSKLLLKLEEQEYNT
jgi:hypothetical protein